MQSRRHIRTTFRVRNRVQDFLNGRSARNISKWACSEQLVWCTHWILIRRVWYRVETKKYWLKMRDNDIVKLNTVNPLAQREEGKIFDHVSVQVAVRTDFLIPRYPPWYYPSPRWVGHDGTAADDCPDCNESSLSKNTSKPSNLLILADQNFT